MISMKKRREMRARASALAIGYRRLWPTATDQEIGEHVKHGLTEEYGVSPAMLLVIAEIVLELIKLWREKR